MYIKVFYSVSQHCFFVSCVSACVFIIRVGGAKKIKYHTVKLVACFGSLCLAHYLEFTCQKEHLQERECPLFKIKCWLDGHMQTGKALVFFMGFYF